MAFQKGYAEVTLEVTAAPGCFLVATPATQKVDRGDTALYTITIQRTGGYEGPIYLQAVNLANGHVFSPEPVPFPETVAILAVDTGGWEPTAEPFAIGIEANDVPYPD